MLQRRKRFDNPIQQYWHVLLKRRLTLGGCVALALAITLVYNLGLLPLYRSQAKILIEDPGRWTGIQDGARFTLDWYLTQFEILKSKPIIAKVVQRLDLTSQYASNPTALETLKARLLRREAGPRQAGPDPQALVPLVQRSISIAPQTATGLVNVVVVASSPRLARDIANALVETFIEENMQARLQMSLQASEYLTRQLQRVSESIREAQSALEEFERREGLEGMAGQALDAQQLSEFIDKLMETRSGRFELEERLKVLESVVQANDFSGIKSPSLENTGLSELTKGLFDAELRLEQLQRQGYLEKHPSVVAAREEIETLRKRLVFESRAYIAGLRTDLAAMQQRERSLEQTIEQFRRPAAESLKRQAQHDYLKRQVDIQTGFYNSLDEQLKKIEIGSDGKTSPVRIVEAAVEPGAPFSPNKRFNLAVGLACGLFIGVFLAFMREYLDDTIKSESDVQEYLETPVLGTIPVIVEARDAANALLPRKLDTASLVTEAYRSLRTNLQFFESERPLQVILVTSSGPSEGKSTTVANIGLTLVQMGKRVCLVDTDLRKPVLHKLFNKSNKSGVTSIFSGATDRRRLLVPSGFDNLLLLPCGPIPPNPSELLASPRMEEALQALRKEFDYVILDSPPALAVTDALVLSSLADGVLLVVKSGEARIGTCQMALDSLSAIKAKVIGVVLNHFNYRQSGYYRHYSRYYREGYGYTYGYGQRREPAAELAETSEKKT